MLMFFHKPLTGDFAMEQTLTDSMDTQTAISVLCEKHPGALAAIAEAQHVIEKEIRDELLPFLHVLDKRGIRGHLIQMLWVRCEMKMENFILVLCLSRADLMSDEETKSLIRGRPFSWTELGQRFTPGAKKRGLA